MVAVRRAAVRRALFVSLLLLWPGLALAQGAPVEQVSPAEWMDRYRVILQMNAELTDRLAVASAKAASLQRQLDAKPKPAEGEK